ncbi:MAG: hypothetical protein IKN65_00715 [Clostridia bacterium]|nr:hypothetical protein [Bacilli bacterium]MBR3672805.1 hypothetical protein [Clostridia bacterium]
MSLEEENKLLKQTLAKIVHILKESNVYPSTDCRLFLEDGVKVVKIIKQCKKKLKEE